MENITFDDMFPSRFLRSGDIPDIGETIVTIIDLTSEKIGDDNKFVLYFDEFDKGLVLNKTNAGVLKDMFGPETPRWKGQKIALYIADVSFQGKTVPSIRIRKRVVKTAVPVQQAAIPEPQVPDEYVWPENS